MESTDFEAGAVPLLRLLDASGLGFGVRLRIALDVLTDVVGRVEGSDTPLVPRAAGSRLLLDRVRIDDSGEAHVKGDGSDTGAAELIWEILAGRELGDGAPAPLFECTDDVSVPVSELIARALEGDKSLAHVEQFLEALEETGRDYLDVHDDVKKSVLPRTSEAPSSSARTDSMPPSSALKVSPQTALPSFDEPSPADATDPPPQPEAQPEPAVTPGAEAPSPAASVAPAADPAPVAEPSPAEDAPTPAVATLMSWPALVVDKPELQELIGPAPSGERSSPAEDVPPAPVATLMNWPALVVDKPELREAVDLAPAAEALPVEETHVPAAATLMDWPALVVDKPGEILAPPASPPPEAGAPQALGSRPPEPAPPAPAPSSPPAAASENQLGSAEGVASSREPPIPPPPVPAETTPPSTAPGKPAATSSISPPAAGLPSTRPAPSPPAAPPGSEVPSVAADASPPSSRRPFNERVRDRLLNFRSNPPSNPTPSAIAESTLIAEASASAAAPSSASPAAEPKPSAAAEPSATGFAQASASVAAEPPASAVTEAKPSAAVEPSPSAVAEPTRDTTESASSTAAESEAREPSVGQEPRRGQSGVTAKKKVRPARAGGSAAEASPRTSTDTIRRAAPSSSRTLRVVAGILLLLAIAVFIWMQR